MAFISGFGIAFAAPILALAALTASVAATPSADSQLEVSVTGLRNPKGNVLICLTANPKAFPDCSKDANAIKRVVKANAASSVVFVGVAPGTYALSLIHDENGNGKLDKNFVGVPSEGYGVSNNKTYALSAPKWDESTFKLGATESKALQVKLRY
jgi:uncharacterized protein (DUF2141 family)